MSKVADKPHPIFEGLEMHNWDWNTHWKDWTIKQDCLTCFYFKGKNKYPITGACDLHRVESYTKYKKMMNKEQYTIKKCDKEKFSEWQPKIIVPLENFNTEMQTMIDQEINDNFWKDVEEKTVYFIEQMDKGWGVSVDELVGAFKNLTFREGLHGLSRKAIEIVLQNLIEKVMVYRTKPDHYSAY